MGITYRQGNDGRLTVQQMDDNFHYLEDQLAGLTSSNSGATGPQGATGATGPAGFGTTGAISFPFLPGNQRTGSGDNLQFEKGSVYQKIISTQDGTGSAPDVERLVICGGDSYQNGPTYSGEGGDVYLYGGKGQNGGDIKVDAGEGISSGGTVKVRGGDTSIGNGGFVEISAGQSNDGYGGDVLINAGSGNGIGSVGGNIDITSGYGNNTGGNISLIAGNGGTAGGNVSVSTSEGTWTFKSDGSIEFPNSLLKFSEGSSIESIPNSSFDALTIVLKPDSSLDTDQYIILDPTEGSPNHIHIRAGGPIDDSTTDLFIGGEDNNLRVSDTDKTVQINSKNLYTQDSASFPSGANYDSATWSGNLITITNPIIGLINLINGYQAATDIFTVFYDPATATSLNITNKDISNYPTHVLTVDQTAPTASLAITQMLIEIVRYQSGRVIADNGTVTIQAGDIDGPENWVFGTTGSITFPDNSVQTTAYAPKYKVYTALLTQSGTSNLVVYTAGTLEIGKTYEIYDLTGAASFDFTNVGAPNNNIGTYFVATGTIPNSWGINVGLRANTGAPLVTVLENTIGYVWFTYVTDGVYSMASNGLFSSEKTLGFITYNDGGSSGLNDKPFLSIYPNNDSNIYVNSALNGVLANDVLSYVSFEIKVYN